MFTCIVRLLAPPKTKFNIFGPSYNYTGVRSHIFQRPSEISPLYETQGMLKECVTGILELVEGGFGKLFLPVAMCVHFGDGM